MNFFAWSRVTSTGTAVVAGGQVMAPPGDVTGDLRPRHG
jgi:hypothetical protein